jgi:hypothetical protein
MARPGLLTHPKFLHLAHLLPDCPVPHLVGYLECMWMTGYDHGRAFLGHALAVELAAKWPGDRGRLCHALFETGFIDGDPEADRYSIHDLESNAPQYVRRRMKRHEQHLAAGVTVSDIRRDAVSQRKDRQGPHDPNPEGTNDYKREPLVTSKVTNDSIPSPAQPSPAQDIEHASHASADDSTKRGKRPRKYVERDHSPAVVVFPTDGEPDAWAYTEARLAKHRDLFPSLDVLHEVRKARQWVDDRPDRRKTASGMARFLTYWLTKANDERRGPAPGGTLFPPKLSETFDERAKRIQAEMRRQNEDVG